MSFGVYSQFQTFGQSQELENILRNNCPTLEELLDRENFLFDLKAGALQAFTEYLCKYPENLEKMVYYIIITNEQMEDNEKSRKFPYIVSEIFALENSRLYDLLFMRHRNESLSSLSNERLTTIEDDILPEYQMHHEDQCKEEEDQAIGQISGTSSSNVYDIIVQCASFKSKSGMHLNENIRQQILTTLFRYLEVPQINDTSIGYYAKILKPLACKYGGDFWDHISQNTNIIGDLMQHINHYQIVEIVVQLLILDYKINDNIIINYRCYSFRKQVMDELIIQLDKQSDQINIVADVTQIFELLLDNGIQHKFYEPLRDLYDSLLKPLYFFKLAKKTNLQIVYQVFAKILILIQVNQSQDQKTADVIQIIQQIVQQIASNLANENSNFGIRNLCLVQALDACDKFNNPLVFESMFQSQVYKNLIEYAINYQWNNQLQIYISSIFKSRIKDEKYCQRLIKDTDILTILKQYFLDQPHNLSYKQKCSYGFNCFLKTTSYTLLEKCKSNKKLNSSIYESNVQLMEEIAKLQKIEQTFLCDAEPKSHMQEAPPEISIDRQVEMLIDAQKQKEEQKQSHYEQQ